MLIDPVVTEGAGDSADATSIQYQGLTVNLGKGATSTSIENRTYWHGETGQFDFLLVFDSRGAMVESEESVSTIDRLEQYFNQVGASYLILSRPLYLTVFPTLLSVLESEQVTFKHVITNVGFVDTTPKKKSVLDDLQAQLNHCQLHSSYRELGDYTLSNGEVENLASNEIDSESIEQLCARLRAKADTFCFVNTPQISEQIPLPRPRPGVFYEQLRVCNQLVNKIATGVDGYVVDIHDADIRTFDGVHYSHDEHQVIFSKLKTYIAGLENSRWGC